MKYVKANQENMADPLVRKFMLTDNLDPNLIRIPREFEDLSVDDVTPIAYRRSAIKKKIMRSRSNKVLTNYDAWRSFDRKMHKGGGQHPAVALITVAPATLIKAFGRPDNGACFDTSTGEFNFEDNNLDCFCLFDYKQTDLYHGMNREDDFYTADKNMKKSPRFRKRKWPTV